MLNLNAYDALIAPGRNFSVGRFKGSYRIRDFLPETYALNLLNPEITDTEKEFFEQVHKGQWIMKPSSSFGGQGIQLVDNITQLKEEILEIKHNLTTLPEL
jgi:hypothetical protein